MKIVCDNCATKYSIADEKVRGKVFKIRCKKCSHIIVVKGTEGGAVEAGASSGDAAAEVGATSGDAAPAGDGWHVVINGEQVGPLQPDEIRAKFHAGEIDAESYAWREGFGDWQKLSSIDDFRDLAAAAPPAEATRRTGSEDIFGGGDPAAAAGGDLFGAPAGGDLFAGGAPTPAASGGLFAQTEAAGKRSPTPGFGQPAMSDGPAPEAKLTGQRNESSVLFSLNNLQALASGGGAKASGGGAQSSVENRPGFANSQTEGSGLIDIRAMAAATLSSSPAHSSGKSDDLPSFSSAPVFSPIAAPILMPAAPSGPPRWIWPVIALGVAAVASIIVVGVLILTKKPEVAVAPAPAPGTAAPAANTGGTAAPPAANTGGTPSANPGTATPAPGATTAPAGDAKTEPKAGGHDTGGHGKKSGKTAAVAASPSPGATRTDPPPSAPAPAAKKGGKKDELDDLLNGATKEDKPKRVAREEPAESSGGGDLPDQLDKGAIVAGMNKVKGKVQGCYEQYKVPGLAMVSVTISHSGKVASASVSGAFSGTPTGDCVAKAVKGASFSAFKNASQTVNYPYSLR